MRGLDYHKYLGTDGKLDYDSIPDEALGLDNSRTLLGSEEWEDQLVEKVLAKIEERLTLGGCECRY